MKGKWMYGVLREGKRDNIMYNEKKKKEKDVKNEIDKLIIQNSGCTIRKR